MAAAAAAAVAAQAEAAAAAAAEAEAAAKAAANAAAEESQQKEEEAAKNEPGRKSPRSLPRAPGGPRGSTSPLPVKRAPASGSGGATRKQLSLSSRKNVKQFQANFADHVSRILEALGLEIEVQSKVEWVSLAEKCDEGGHKFACGEIFYDKVMGGLADNLCKLAGTPGRDALVEDWSTGAISIVFDPEQESQWSLSFPNGDMEIVCRGEPWSETELVGSDYVQPFLETAAGSGNLTVVPTAVEEDDDAVDDETGLPIRAARSLRDYDGKFNEALARQRAALNLDYDIVVDVDFFEVLPMLQDASKIGPAWHAALAQLATVLEEAVAADPGIQSRIADLWTTAILKLMNDDGLDQWMIDFVDGDLILIASSEIFLDVSTLGSDLVERVNEMCEA